MIRLIIEQKKICDRRRMIEVGNRETRISLSLGYSSARLCHISTLTPCVNGFLV